MTSILSLTKNFRKALFLPLMTALFPPFMPKNPRQYKKVLPAAFSHSDEKISRHQLSFCFSNRLMQIVNNGYFSIRQIKVRTGLHDLKCLSFIGESPPKMEETK